MLVGMGTVFCFLTLVVWTTGLLTAAVQRVFPEPPAGKDNPQAASEEVAAVIAAVHRHRAQQ